MNRGVLREGRSVVCAAMTVPGTGLLPLGLLARTELRKVATDCGFDVLEDAARWVAAASTQAPLAAWLGLAPRQEPCLAWHREHGFRG